MGVKGLASYVRSQKLGQKLKRTCTDQKAGVPSAVLLVDAASLKWMIYESVQKAVRDGTRGAVPFPELYGRGNSLSSKTLELFVLTLRKAGCEPVFIFDGVDVVETAANIPLVLQANSHDETGRSKLNLVTASSLELKSKTRQSRAAESRTAVEDMMSHVEDLTSRITSSKRRGAYTRPFGPTLLAMIQDSNRAAAAQDRGGRRVPVVPPSSFAGPGPQIIRMMEQTLRALGVRYAIAPGEADEMLAAEAWSTVVRHHGGLVPATETSAAEGASAAVQVRSNDSSDATVSLAHALGLGIQQGETCLGILSSDSDMCVYAPLKEMQETMDQMMVDASASTGTSASATESILSRCGWIPLDSLQLSDDSLTGIEARLLSTVFGGDSEPMEKSNGSHSAADLSADRPASFEYTMVSPKDVCDALDITVAASSDLERATMLHESCAIAGADFTAPFFQPMNFPRGSSLFALADGLKAAVDLQRMGESNSRLLSVGRQDMAWTSVNLAGAAQLVIEQCKRSQSYRMEDIPQYAAAIKRASKEDRGELLKALAGTRSTFGLEPEVAYTATEAPKVIVDAVLSVMYPESDSSGAIPSELRSTLDLLALASLSSIGPGAMLMGIMARAAEMPRAPPTKPLKWLGPLSFNPKIPSSDQVMLPLLIAGRVASAFCWHGGSGSGSGSGARSRFSQNLDGLPGGVHGLAMSASTYCNAQLEVLRARSGRCHVRVYSSATTSIMCLMQQAADDQARVQVLRKGGAVEHVDGMLDGWGAGGEALDADATEEPAVLARRAGLIVATALTACVQVHAGILRPEWTLRNWESSIAEADDKRAFSGAVYARGVSMGDGTLTTKSTEVSVAMDESLTLLTQVFESLQLLPGASSVNWKLQSAAGCLMLVASSLRYMVDMQVAMARPEHVEEATRVAAASRATDRGVTRIDAALVLHDVPEQVLLQEAVVSEPFCDCILLAAILSVRQLLDDEQEDAAVWPGASASAAPAGPSISVRTIGAITVFERVYSRLTDFVQFHDDARCEPSFMPPGCIAASLNACGDDATLWYECDDLASMQSPCFGTEVPATAASLGLSSHETALFTSIKSWLGRQVSSKGFAGNLLEPSQLRGTAAAAAGGGMQTSITRSADPGRASQIEAIQPTPKQGIVSWRDSQRQSSSATGAGDGTNAGAAKLESSESSADFRQAAPAVAGNGAAQAADPSAATRTEDEESEDHDEVASNPRQTGLRASKGPRLPIHDHERKIKQRLTRDQVTVLTADTGSGKSSQVPQFLAQLLHGTGFDYRVCVTQPRRVAARTLSQRVAFEMDCEPLGGLVGYRVGGERLVSKDTRISFVTTGWLLQWLVANLQKAAADGNDLLSPLDTVRGRRGASSSDSFVEGIFADVSEGANWSHIVLDEVHERSLDTDLLCMLLRRATAAAGKHAPKMVVMSATLDAKLFASYFSLGLQPGAIADWKLNDRGREKETGKIGAGVGISPIHVGAKRFPVSITFLDQILRENSVQRPRSLEEGKARIEAGLDPFADTGRLDRITLPSFVSRAVLRAMEKLSVTADEASRPGKSRPGLDEVVLAPTEEQARLKLAVYLASRVCRPGETVLVFLSGLADIMSCCEMCEDEVVVPVDVQRTLDVIPMHSLLPQEEQMRAFTSDGKPPAGAGGARFGSDNEDEADSRASEDEEATDIAPLPHVRAYSAGDEEDSGVALDRSQVRRIVFATNIAESSITIPDVTTVIDLGHHKELRYDSRLGAAVLKQCFVSKASAIQRSGRAGRLGPGKCFRLYPEHFFEAVMPGFDQPEMLRLPLDSTVLRCRAMGLQGTGNKLLSDAPQPPLDGAVVQAERRLVSMGLLEELPQISAFDELEPSVTPMGQMLSTFPGDARLGVLVSLATALGNPIEGILVAASATVTDVFLMPNPARATSPTDFCDLMLRVGGSRVALDGGALSDSLVARAAYLMWRRVPKVQRSQWASNRGLMHRRLQHMHSFVVECSRRIQEHVRAGNPSKRGYQDRSRGGQSAGRGRVGRSGGGGSASRSRTRVIDGDQRTAEEAALALDALSNDKADCSIYERWLSEDVDAVRLMTDATLGVSQRMMADETHSSSSLVNQLPHEIGSHMVSRTILDAIDAVDACAGPARAGGVQAPPADSVSYVQPARACHPGLWLAESIAVEPKARRTPASEADFQSWWQHTATPKTSCVVDNLPPGLASAPRALMAIIPKQLRGAVLAVVVIPSAASKGKQKGKQKQRSSRDQRVDIANSIRRGTESISSGRYVPSTRSAPAHAAGPPQQGKLSKKEKKMQKKLQKQTNTTGIVREGYAAIFVFEPGKLVGPMSKASCEAISPLLTEADREAAFFTASVSPQIEVGEGYPALTREGEPAKYDPSPATGLSDALSLFLAVSGVPSYKAKVTLFGLVASVECALAESISTSSTPRAFRVSPERQRYSKVFRPSDQPAWGKASGSPASQEHLSSDLSPDESVLRVTRSLLTSIDAQSGIATDVYQEYRRRSRQSLRGLSLPEEEMAEYFQGEPDTQYLGLFPRLESQAHGSTSHGGGGRGKAKAGGIMETVIGPSARYAPPATPARGGGRSGRGGASSVVSPALMARVKEATAIVQSSNVETLPSPVVAGMVAWKCEGRRGRKPLVLPMNACISRTTDLGACIDLSNEEGDDASGDIADHLRLPLTASFGSLSLHGNDKPRWNVRCVVSQPRTIASSLLWTIIAGRSPQLSLVLAMGLRSAADAPNPLPSLEPWVLMASEMRVDQDGTAYRGLEATQWPHENSTAWCSPTTACIPLYAIVDALRLRSRLTQCIATRERGRGSSKRIPYLRPDPEVARDGMQLVQRAEEEAKTCCRSLWNAVRGRPGGVTSKIAGGGVVNWARETGCELAVVQLQEADDMLEFDSTIEGRDGLVLPSSGAGTSASGRAGGSGRRGVDEHVNLPNPFLARLSPDDVLGALAHFFKLAARLHLSESAAICEQGGDLMRECSAVASELMAVPLPRGGPGADGAALAIGEAVLAAGSEGGSAGGGAGSVIAPAGNDVLDWWRS